MTDAQRYPPYPEGMILLVEVGSTAHGTGLPGGEDHDETAVVMETPGQVLGLRPGLENHMQRTQPEGQRSGPGDTDRQVYSLRKFLAMAAAGNPSILLTLWAPVIEATDLGRDLIALREAFVGRHVLPRYRGYMQSQVMRMQGLKGSGHGRRGGGKREELIATHGYDTKFAMHAARLGYQGYELVTCGGLTLPVGGAAGDWLRAVRRGEVAFDEWLARVHELDATSLPSPTTTATRPAQTATASRRSPSRLTDRRGTGSGARRHRQAEEHSPPG